MSRLTTLARTGRRTKMSVKRMSGLFARARAQRLQPGIRIDAHARIRLQFDLAFADDELAGLHPLIDSDLVFARVAGAHEAPLDRIKLVRAGCLRLARFLRSG